MTIRIAAWNKVQSNTLFSADNKFTLSLYYVNILEE